MSTLHSAASSFTGYLYQARQALLLSLKESRLHPSHALAIEKFDDVSFEDDGIPVELIQTKHHSNRHGNVSDQSSDVWRTLNVWIQLFIEDPMATLDTRLVFLTTNVADHGSAFSMLRQSKPDRDEKRALELLIDAATKSRNQSTQATRQSFLNLQPSAQRALISNIWVFDQAPNIIDVRQEIEDVLYYSVEPSNVNELTDQLEGWWFRQVITALSDPKTHAISLASVRNKVSELRERFKLSNLPLDETIDLMQPIEDIPGNERKFVRQMNLIHLGKSEIRASVHDFYRAFAQRSRWVREELFIDGESNRYDRHLCDAWEREFIASTADISDDCDDDVKETQGKKVFRWARSYQKPLRNREEIWLSAGSFQMLADEERVGWHPNFESLLKSSKD